MGTALPALCFCALSLVLALLVGISPISDKTKIRFIFVICNFAPSHCVNVFHVYRPTVFSGSRACSATLFAVSRWKRACSRAENYSKQCKAKGFLKILLGVSIVFVKNPLDILSLHIPDEPFIFISEVQPILFKGSVLYHKNTWWNAKNKKMRR